MSLGARDKLQKPLGRSAWCPDRDETFVAVKFVFAVFHLLRSRWDAVNCTRLGILPFRKSGVDIDDSDGAGTFIERIEHITPSIEHDGIGDDWKILETDHLVAEHSGIGIIYLPGEHEDLELRFLRFLSRT